MTIFSLSDRVAIVTGGSKGLGKAITLALSEAGANTVVVSRHLSEAQQVTKEAKSLGHESLAIESDVTNYSDVARMVEKTISYFGKIDILVNNAGITLRKPILDFTVEEWDKILATNLIACYICSKEVCKHMMERKTGNIINIASMAASVVVPERAVYAASKAGLVQLTKHLAVELAPYGIRANAICPGTFETDMIRRWVEKGGSYDYFIQRIPMKRIGQPSEIGGTVVYLASNASSFVTGTTIYIDGGWSAL